MGRLTDEEIVLRKRAQNKRVRETVYLAVNTGEKSYEVKCPYCGLTHSYPHDVKYKYCSNCRVVVRGINNAEEVCPAEKE